MRDVTGARLSVFLRNLIADTRECRAARRDAQAHGISNAAQPLRQQIENDWFGRHPGDEASQWATSDSLKTIPYAHRSHKWGVIRIDFSVGPSFNARTGILPADCCAAVAACGCWRREFNMGDPRISRRRLVVVGAV